MPIGTINKFLDTNLDKLSNVKDIYSLFKTLGYKTLTPDYRGKDVFDLKDKDKKNVKNIYVVCNYDKQFQIFLVEVAQLTTPLVKSLLHSFEKEIQYPMFVITQDYKEYVFCIIEKIRTGPGEFRRKVVKLNLDTSNVYHTDKLILSQITPAEQEENPQAIFNKIKEAFNVEKVTKEFFEAYKSALDYICKNMKMKPRTDDKTVHSFAMQLLSRIMFLYFIQKKRFFKWKDYEQDIRYIKNLWARYKKTGDKDRFYDIWLSNLFFKAFQGPKNSSIHSENRLPDDIKESFIHMPYLNGGLFTENELDQQVLKVPDHIFEYLFEPDPFNNHKGFLEKYHFTIRESEPLDIEVAVDPEMLGKVYESLITEEERGKAGIFYTPRFEIDYMCRLTLVEYFERKATFSRDKIIKFVFDPITNKTIFTPKELGQIISSLEELKVVDPAVGSASFLVGMMNVLISFYRIASEIRKEPFNEFAIKKRIISQNLYGVDVKDWAVMVGELRLWLSLIIESDEKTMDLYENPLLPNLTFKIRQGDSLIEEFSGISLNVRKDTDKLNKELRPQIDKLIILKTKFFKESRMGLKKQIDELEHEIFKKIIDLKISHINKALSIGNSNDQLLLSALSLNIDNPNKKRQTKKIKVSEELNTQLEKLKKVRKEIGKKSVKDYFLWDIDFAEVFFDKGGFDIAIGNPPYVRQELIAPPLETPKNHNSDKWRETKKEYKDTLIKSVNTLWDNRTKIDKKSDLYVYFYYAGLSLLRKGGTFCFVNSNSWLDVGYGAPLQEFLLRNMEVKQIIDNQAKRTFEADVNTVIVVIKKPSDAGTVLDSTIRFIAYKKPFEEAVKLNNLFKMEQAKERTENEEFRVFPITQKEMLLRGVEKSDETKPELVVYNRYLGDKWGGKYLRAPEIYFKILEKGKGKLVRLGDIAEVRFGIKTGANEFFYLPSKHFDIKKEGKFYKLIPKYDGLPNNILLDNSRLVPVIVSPKDSADIIKQSNVVKHLLLLEKATKMNSSLKSYISWGETMGFNLRPSCITRDHWWAIGSRQVCTIACNYLVNDYMRSFFSHVNAFFSDNFQEIHSQYSPYSLSINFNSILFQFFINMIGRSNFGGGLLKIQTYELKEIPVIKPDFLIKCNREKIISTFSTIFSKSLFYQCNINPKLPIRSQTPNPLPDRKRLDDIVFDILGLTQGERNEVYWSVCELVKNRLDKAKNR